MFAIHRSGGGGERRFRKWRFHGLDGDQLPQQRYCHIPAHPEKPSEFAASRYGPSDAGGERGIRHARECARRTRTAITIPFQGSYSARINARGNNNRASGIQQSAQIALADVDPVDGKVHLRMVVAPVIQDGGHSPEQQAYFYVEVRNVTKGTRLFYTFNFAAQPGVPWQTLGGYQYTGWQAIDVAPGSGLLDVGDTVEVEVIAAGCSQGGHSGEVYVDSIGPFFAGLLVSATGPTTAQPSDNVAYTYTYSNNSGVMVFNSKVSAQSPQVRNAANTATIDAVFQSVTAPAGATCTTPAVGSAGTVTCDFGSLVDHQSGTFEIVWGVPAGASTSSPTNSLNHGTYSMSATGASTVLGPLVQTRVVSGATLTDLTVSVSDGVSASAVGSASTYTVVVSNNGPAPVIGAALTQPTVSGLTVGNWTCSGTAGGSCQGGRPRRVLCLVAVCWWTFQSEGVSR